MPPTAERPPVGAAGTAELADLFALLAAAFALPPAQLAARTYCEPLAADLADVGVSLALDTSQAQAALHAAAQAGGEEPWLVAYSRLFLVPPVRVPLNAGIYLEGALAGVSAQMLSQCYATAGFAQREDFRDLPDHVALQLEFVSALIERSARGDDDALAMGEEFVAAFVAHWAQPLQRACASAAEADTADASAEVYAALAELLVRVAERFAPPASRARGA